MRTRIGSMRNRRSVPFSRVALFVLVVMFGGVTLAPNMGFKLNVGVLNGINRLFYPSGYGEQGEWSGKGSGISWSLRMPQEAANVVSLDMRTPAGTFSVPYAAEEKCPRGRGRIGSQGVVFPNPYMRYSGTNLSYNPNEPLMFTSADGVAQITIESSATWNPMVRYTGTGLCIGTGANRAYIHVTPGIITLELGEGAAIQTETWKFSPDTGWTKEP